MKCYFYLLVSCVIKWCRPTQWNICAPTPNAKLPNRSAQTFLLDKTSLLLSGSPRGNAPAFLLNNEHVKYAFFPTLSNLACRSRSNVNGHKNLFFITFGCKCHKGYHGRRYFPCMVTLPPELLPDAAAIHIQSLSKYERSLLLELVSNTSGSPYLDCNQFSNKIHSHYNEGQEKKVLRVLGINDWTFRKGINYGTVLPLVV